MMLMKAPHGLPKNSKFIDHSKQKDMWPRQQSIPSRGF